MVQRNIFIHYRLPVILTNKSSINNCIIEVFKNNILNSKSQFTSNQLLNRTLNKKDYFRNVYVHVIPGSNNLFEKNCIHMGMLSNYTEENANILLEYQRINIMKELRTEKNMIPIFPKLFKDKDEKFGNKILKLSRFETYENVYEYYDDEESFYHNLKLCSLFAIEIHKEVKEGDRIFITSPELWMLPYCLSLPKITMCFYLPLIQPDIFLSMNKSTEIIKSWISCNSFEFQSIKDKNYFKEIIYRQISIKIQLDFINKQLFLNPLGINFDYILKMLLIVSPFKINKLLSITKKEIPLILNIVPLDNMDAAQDIMIAFNKIKNKKYMLINCLLPIGNSFSQLDCDNLTKSLVFFNLSSSYFRTIPITTNLLLYKLYNSANALISLYNEKSILEFKRLTGKPVISSSLSRISSIPINLSNMFFVNPKDHKEISGVIKYIMSETYDLNPNKFIPDSIQYLNKSIYYSDKGFKADLKKKEEKIPKEFTKEIQNKLISENSVFNIYCDYDGTLTEIVDNPNDAKPTEDLLNLLNSISINSNLTIITGRTSDFINKYFNNSKYTIYAEHGAEVYENGKWLLSINNNEWIDEALVVAKFFEKRTPGLNIELKKSALTIHYRACSKLLNYQINDLEKIMKKFLLNYNVKVKRGKKIIEVTPLLINKGSIINKQPGISFCIGDDTTDEDMFKKCIGNNDMYSILIGNRPSLAKWRFKGVSNVINLLKEIDNTLKEKQ